MSAVTEVIDIDVDLAELSLEAFATKAGITPGNAAVRIHRARQALGHKPRFITGHIDFLQVRNGSIHILDYKPDARTNKPIAQLVAYALALSRLVPGLTLADFRCAWFNETCYNEFAPARVLRSRGEKWFLGEDF